MSKAKEEWDCILMYPAHDTLDIATNYIDELEKQKKEYEQALKECYLFSRSSKNYVEALTKMLLERNFQKPIEKILKEV